jgi:ubiquinone/menaquinone biosynthesis C-methylase UbiE
MTEAEAHFDRIARQYDYWKKKNAYYYRNLVKLYRSLIPEGSSVLEIGCGTGDIICLLDVREGRGTDLSHEMIEIAQKKHVDQQNITFVREDIFESNTTFTYEYIFLADVLEHVEDVPQFLGQLARRTPPRTKIIVTLANPLWEPLLMLSEKLHMKMPEGPHYRHPIPELERLFVASGLQIRDTGFRLLIPKSIPGADWVNARFYHNRFLRKFGFMVYWILSR